MNHSTSPGCSANWWLSHGVAQYFRPEPWVGCLSDSVLLSEGSARAAALSLLVAEDFALHHVVRQRPEAKECKD